MLLFAGVTKRIRKIMKTFKYKTLLMTGPVTLALATFLTVSDRANAGGTDILHLSEVAFMTNSNIEPNADGVVMFSQKAQGKSNNQKLSVALKGLIADNTYELVAIYDTDTNVVDVGPFTTDAKGKAVLYFTSLGKGHGGGKHSSPLPGSLDPLSLVRELDIVDTNMQVVLTADLVSPSKLQYLVKRNLSAQGIKASLLIHDNGKKTQFRLFSTGLDANTDYLLVLNDEVVQTNQSDSKGKLKIRNLNDTPPNILDVRSVALWDTSSNVVLQTELP